MIKNDRILNKAEEIALLGDFNINLIKHNDHEPTAKFLDTLLSYNLLPLITLPSRITPNTSSLLDHLYTNKMSNSYDSGLIYTALSDHLPVFNISQLNENVKRDSNVTQYCRTFSQKK